MKEYTLSVAAQLENEKAIKKQKREQENTKTVTSPTRSNNQSQKDELRQGLAEGLMYKQLQKVSLIWKKTFLTPMILYLGG